jgi:hypothetical protein
LWIDDHNILGHFTAINKEPYFRPELSAEAKAGKYDPSADVAIALMKYGGGMPLRPAGALAGRLWRAAAGLGPVRAL